MADAIENSKPSWFSFLGMNTPLKTSLATVAFAFALVVAMPEISQHNTQEHNPISMPQSVVHNDVINAIPFDSNQDRLSKAGFDVINEGTTNDDLFDGSFG